MHVQALMSFNIQIAIFIIFCYSQREKSRSCVLFLGGGRERERALMTVTNNEHFKVHSTEIEKAISQIKK